MSFQPVLNPELPFVGEVQDGLIPGKMVKVQGRVPLESTRFAINYQLGPILNPRDDIALHVSPRFCDGFITRNHIKSMTWGSEENDGPMWIELGMPFEIIILCEYHCFKIAINGRHFTEFTHRLPYDQITHLVIDGEVEITSIFYESIPIGPKPSAPVPDVPDLIVGPPPPGKLYPMLYPHGFPKEKNGSPLDSDDFKSNPTPAYGSKSVQETEEDIIDNCLDKVGLAVGGLVAAGGVAAALHAYNKNKNQHANESSHEKSESIQNESGLGGLGVLRAALANSLASNAFQGNKAAHAQQGYPPQDSSSGMLGSILGALGETGQPAYQQTSTDPLSGALGSILGRVLGSDDHQYQPTGGYGNYSQNQKSQDNNFLGGFGGVVIQSAMDGLSKRLHTSHQEGADSNICHYSAPPPSTIYSKHDKNVPASHPSPTASRDARLTATEISKGLGLSEDEKYEK